GIFIPILPTTPFLLLASSCFIKSSPKFYNWLINNKQLGKYIKNYRENKGVPLKVKITSISFLWGTITYSFFFITQIWTIRIILLLIAIGVTLHIFSIKTFKQK
ncbi:MAG: YbaN family protein, partial [Calditrichia bacterium]|nr:YbaN family protein [Calditrichia bacterium]